MRLALLPLFLACLDREHVLIPMRVDADHVIQLICKHPSDPPASLVGSGWCRSECRETAAAGR